MSTYQQTNTRFRNISELTIVTHKVEDAELAAITKSLKRIFKNFDRQDEEAKKLAGLIWVFRTIINATSIPFDNTLLELKERYQEILLMLQKQGIDPILINMFKESAQNLLKKHKNNKFERILDLSKNLIDKNNSIALLGKILYGNDPACIDITISSLLNHGIKCINIENKRQLYCASFSNILILSPPTKASFDLMRTIFYTGVTQEIDLITYEHENFYVPSRVELPSTPLFKENIQRIRPLKVFASEPVQSLEESELNSWAEDSFWSGIHSGSRVKTTASIGAHYILFDSGEGAFMPIDGKILHIDRKFNNEIFNYDLSYLDILDLSEGDYVLLRKNSSGFLLNEGVDSPDHNEGSNDILDRITDWKSSLGALSITKDYSEIAELIRAKGLKISSNRIRGWEGVNVIAPNTEVEFHCLISVLVDEGKLNLTTNDVKNYSQEKWASILEYRVSRQKAGNRARQTLLESLLDKIKGIDIDTAIGAQSLNTELGQNLLIRRVASIDASTSYVHQSDLYKIDDLRGNKWLR